MSEFEQDVITRLTRLETKMDNGIRADIASIKEWIKPRPKTCPFMDRRNLVMRPLLLAVGAAVGVKLLDWIPMILK